MKELSSTPVHRPTVPQRLPPPLPSGGIRAAAPRLSPPPPPIPARTPRKTTVE